MSNSKSESESFFLGACLIFLGALEFVEAAAERIREDGSSSSSSRSSSSSSLRLGAGPGRSGKSNASVTSKIASSSAGNEYALEYARKGGRTFYAAFSVGAPCHYLVSNVTLPVYDDHGTPRVWEIGDTFIAHNGDELRSRISLGECSYMLERAIASRKSAIGIVRFSACTRSY
jgi:hypothetical protein